jgi:hypothetical protein
MRDNDPDYARALARDLLAAIGKGQRPDPEPLLKRFDRIIAASMPPALAYALGYAEARYGVGGPVAALLRREGMMDGQYSWLTDRGKAIVAIFEEAIEAAVPEAVEPDPTPGAPPTPTEAPIEQPVAPTFTPDPTPPGVPVVNPDPAAKATAGDVMGLSALTQS